MVDNPFDKLAEELGVLPEEIEEAYLQATEKALNEEGRKLYQNLKKSGTSELDNHLEDKGLAKTKNTYTYEVDWSEELVNPNRKPRTERVRQPGKRDYGVAPATWRDLAFIINFGRRSDEDNHTIVAGNNFITKAWRNAKKWKKKQEINFSVNLDLLAKQLGEDDK